MMRMMSRGTPQVAAVVLWGLLGLLMVMSMLSTSGVSGQRVGATGIGSTPLDVDVQFYSSSDDFESVAISGVFVMSKS